MAWTYCIRITSHDYRSLCYARHWTIARPRHHRPTAQRRFAPTFDSVALSIDRVALPIGSKQADLRNSV